MTRAIQTTLAGEVTVEPTGWRHTVAFTMGGTTHTLTATEAASIALALQVAVADTFNTPQADSITSVRSANVRRTKADLIEASFDLLMSEC